MPSRPAAGYFVLSNETGRTRTLVGAASPGCGALMLHRSVNANGQERMEMVDSVPVPAHGEVKFAPGGYHLMCMSPTAAVARGGSVSVTLRFKDGGSLAASFPVRGATGGSNELHEPREQAGRIGVLDHSPEIGRDTGDIACRGAERGNEQARGARAVEDIDR